MLWGLCDIDFVVFWASWGGSGNVQGTDGGSRFRYVSMGSDRFWGSEWFEVSMGSDQVSMSSDRFRVSKVVPGFEGFGVPGFDGFLMGSDRFEGFRWGPGPRACHLGVGAVRLAVLCGE